MPLRDSLRHKLTRLGLETIESADSDWRAGRILNEEPFLSAVVRQSEARFFEWDLNLLLKLLIPLSASNLMPPLTQVLRRRRIHCDLEVLHRQGNLSTDKYGADLALSIETDGFKKIAIIQTKISNSKKVIIDTKQLNKMLASGIPIQCLFVLACEKLEFDYRFIAANSSVLRPKPHATTKASSKTQKLRRRVNYRWTPFADWWVKWLRCDIGGMTNEEYDSAKALLTTRMTVSDRIAPDVESWSPMAWIRVTNVFEARY